MTHGDPERGGMRDGLRAGSGLAAGIVGGAIGAAISVVLAKNDAVRDAETNIQYLAIFGSYGAALGAVLLAANAARREHTTLVGSFLVGAILGGGAGGLGSLALIRAIVEPVLRRTDDPKTAFRVAVALSLGALGMCLGLALGVIRSGVAALVSAVAGAVVGAIGGVAYVEFVLFSDHIRTQSDVDTAAMLTLTVTGAAIGLALGAIHPAARATPMDVSARSGVPSPTGPPPANPLPLIPWAYPEVEPTPIAPAPVVAPAPPVAPAPSIPHCHPRGRRGLRCASTMVGRSR